MKKEKGNRREIWRMRKEIIKMLGLLISPSLAIYFCN
jgi:hypothetical protein